MKNVILDCYTDEPSGYGVRPFLGTHQLHLAQALSYQQQDYDYITIDDLRYNSYLLYGDKGIIAKHNTISTQKEINQITLNCQTAIQKLQEADFIYIVMGCFVTYEYFSSQPPQEQEVYNFIKDTRAKKVLFYVLGTENFKQSLFASSRLSKIVDDICFGNTYRYILNDRRSVDDNLLLPNYDLLNKIYGEYPKIIEQLQKPIIAEIETGTGCNTPTCSYCIEAQRKIKPVYREPHSIIKQVEQLYLAGVRHFRLGRQPNFFHYCYQDATKLEIFLSGIRNVCPDLKTLHIMKSL